MWDLTLKQRITRRAIREEEKPEALEEGATRRVPLCGIGFSSMAWRPIRGSSEAGFASVGAVSIL